MITHKIFSSTKSMIREEIILNIYLYKYKNLIIILINIKNRLPNITNYILATVSPRNSYTSLWKTFPIVFEQSFNYFLG